MKKEFWENGYVRLGKLFSQDEVDLIKESISKNSNMQKSYAKSKQKVEKGQHPSFATIFTMNQFDTIYARACLRRKIVDSVSEYFDDDAYLYHSKVALKYSGMVGFKWHQDYYYWYKMGCLLPNMATCFIALDPATRENGCLKVIPKSHLCGRMDHILHNGTHEDSECVPDRVKILEEKFGVDYFELEPGEVTIHHGNMLHASDNNESSISRLALLGCFNTKMNSPIKSLHYQKKLNHPVYSENVRHDTL